MSLGLTGICGTLIESLLAQSPEAWLAVAEPESARSFLRYILAEQVSGGRRAQVGLKTTPCGIYRILEFVSCRGRPVCTTPTNKGDHESISSHVHFYRTFLSPILVNFLCRETSYVDSERLRTYHMVPYIPHHIPCRQMRSKKEKKKKKEPSKLIGITRIFIPMAINRNLRRPPPPNTPHFTHQIGTRHPRQTRLRARSGPQGPSSRLLYYCFLYGQPRAYWTRTLLW